MTTSQINLPQLQNTDSFLKYQSILEENDRLRIENALLNQKRTVRQQQKCPHCEELEQKLKDLQVEYDLLKGRCDEAERKLAAINVEQKDEFQDGPDRNAMVNRVRDDDRLAASTTKRQPARTRRGLNRGFE